MARYSPYQQPTIPDAFYDKDQLAAALRIFHSQIAGHNSALAFAQMCAAAQAAYTAYMHTKNVHLTGRFTLTRHVDTALDHNDYDSWVGFFENTARKAIIRNIVSRISYVCDIWGVNQGLVAGVTIGTVYNDQAMSQVVASTIAGLIGASSIITDIPTPNLAGSETPQHFGKSTSRKKYKKKYY